MPRRRGEANPATRTARVRMEAFDDAPPRIRTFHVKAIVGGDGVNETQKQALPQAIAILAKEHPTSLLLELDGNTTIRKPMVLYADESLDITPELLRIYDRVLGVETK